MKYLCRDFHGYTIFSDGVVLGKKYQLLKTQLRKRRGGGVDVTVRLYYRGKYKKWTLQRLIAAAFIGPIDGYEINHKDRNTLNNDLENLERVTPSENQLHWRKTKRGENNGT